MDSPETPGTPREPDAPQSPPSQPPAAPAAPAPLAEVPPEVADYPVQADAERQEEYSRFLPLVKWLLAIPHYIALAVVGIIAFFAVIGAFFAVLFTGRYPRGIFDFVVGVFRWGFRVTAYVLLTTDRYPPFSLGEEPDYPARLEIEYPGEMERWRPLVQWILAIPYLFVANILMDLVSLLAFFALFTILFTKRFPEGMFKILVVGLRWQARGTAYALFLTKRYPPFVWG